MEGPKKGYGLLAPLDGGCHPPVQLPGRRLPRPGRPHGRTDNFDHHTHSTEAEECGEEGHEHETTTPVHPWIYNRDFTIPAGSRVYDASVPITVPAEADPGEYHFAIRVTDAAGWQQIRSLSIHIH